MLARSFGWTRELCTYNPSPSGNTTLDSRWCSRVVRIGIVAWSVVLSIDFTEVSKTVHFREAEGQDTREGTSHGADKIEYGIPLLEIVTWIPAGQEIGASWEETGLEDTENDTERNHLGPLQYESKANHAYTPQNRDRGEEDSWPDFAENDCRRWLQDNVGNEEDERDD